MAERHTGKVTRQDRSDSHLARDLVEESSENLLINGDFSVIQRGATDTDLTAVVDDTYNIDRWVVLSENNDNCDIQSDTGVKPTGARAACLLTVGGTNNEKFGIIQFVEAKNSERAIGGNVSLSYQARQVTGTSIDQIYAAVLSWTGTADTLTSDIVTTWGATDTLPTAGLAASWTLESPTPIKNTLTTSYQTFSIDTIPIDVSNAENIAVFIWNDDSTASTEGDSISIANVNLTQTSVAQNFEPRDFITELTLCRRYFWRAADGDNIALWVGQFDDTDTLLSFAQFPVEMRSIPALAISNVAHMEINSGAASTTCDALTADTGTHHAQGILIIASVSGTPFTASESGRLQTLDPAAKLDFDIEL